MTAILKQKMMELGRDESGVAFAFTVTVSLIIFLFGFAVYACGETVRQRIELQNAADAAAYSGALVQADTISRIAVINKAMAWNYVMMTRRQMDHIVGVWLGKVTERWLHDCSVTAVAQQTCACCWHKIEALNWRVGVDPAGGASEGIAHQVIRLNESQNVGIPEILAGRAAEAAQNPVSLLSSLRKCVASMNQAEKELISGMKKRIENAVEFVLNANVSLTENDRKTRKKRKIQWSLYELKDAGRYFEALKSKEESRFLGFGDFSGSTVETLGTGANTWLTLANAEGFQRNYRQTVNTLTARWFTYNQIWWHSTVCHYAGFSAHAAPPVTGEEGRDAYYIGEKASPMVLKSNFFKPDGAIVVGVSRPLNNPFAFIFGGGEQSGIYSAFSVGGGRQTMWSIAGARAGYRLPEWEKGEYRNTGSIEAKDNLCVADWDALFLPLRDKDSTAKSSLLEDLAKKLGASKTFVGKDQFSSYSTIEFSGAKFHLHH